MGKGEYELLNTLTYQFVSVKAGGARTLCRGNARCRNYLKLLVTEYSGNTAVTVSPRQLSLLSRSRAIYAPVAGREARPVAGSGELLERTVLQPDDDGDFVSGAVVFVVPPGAGRYNLRWQGVHVATVVTTARGGLSETR